MDGHGYNNKYIHVTGSLACPHLSSNVRNESLLEDFRLINFVKFYSLIFLKVLDLVVNV